jgi:hypothetical protein
MDILGTLPVWAQLLIAFLVAGVLVVMNVGWLMQARGWLEQQKQPRAKTQGGTSTARPETTERGGA